MEIATVSSTYIELAEKFVEARTKYVALVKGAEIGHMSVGQFADEDDLVAIKVSLDAILMKAKDYLSDYEEYLEVTEPTVMLRNAVESALLTARYIDRW